MLVGVLCPDGSAKTFEECYACEKCLPKRILMSVVRPTRRKFPDLFDTTELVSPCALKQVYERTRLYYEKYYKFLAIFRGIAIHERLERVFNVVESQFLRKIRIEGEPVQIRGVCDIVEPDTIIELKSIKYPLRAHRPLTHHLLQLQSYLSYAMQSELQEFSNISKGMLVYFSDLGTERFTVEPVDITDFLDARANLTYQMLNRKVGLEGNTSWVCGYCAFNQDCRWAPPPEQLRKKTGLWAVKPAKGILEEHLVKWAAVPSTKHLSLDVIEEALSSYKKI